MAVSIAALGKDLGDETLAGVKDALGDDWDRLSKTQKDSIRRTAKRYMTLKLKQRLGEDVDEQLRLVESTIKDWKVVGEISLESAFWKGVQRAANVLAGFLSTFAMGVI